MRYQYFIILLIQIITAVHAIKKGRSWFWLWIILFFPLVGSAIYFIVEVMPDLRRFTFRSKADGILNVLQPDRELRLLKEQLDFSDTLENRKALADYYLRINQPQRAIELYKSCLDGAFRNDPEVILDLCSALFSAQLYEESKTTLEDLRDRHPPFNPSRRELLFARTLEKLGQESAAIGIYEGLVSRYSSEVEARCRLALLLEKLGEREKAKSEYEDILKRAKGFSGHYRRSQRNWINLAKEGIRRLYEKG